MPITFTKHMEDGYFQTKFVGKISKAELVPSYRIFFEGADWSPGLSELADLSDADLSEVDAEAVSSLMEYSERHYQANHTTNVKVAIYAPHDLGFGLSRMYSMLAEQSPEVVAVFRSLSDAQHWLAKK